MKKISIQYFNTSIGELIIGSYENKICLLDYRYRKMRVAVDNRIKKGLNADFVFEENDILNELKKQIAEYLNGLRTIIDLPILTVGTDFQKSVWNELLKIPYGNTESYINLSKKLNNQKAVRAVASANGANAIAIIIPCHRIIGSDGNLVGYAGGLNAKSKLLKLESKQVDLFSDIE